ncbi:hypothetical protein HYDPIDRAFT_32974 [Hydnomerulius pinastri MD-312]|uniref:Uncharacterized protein n=1 Tax=Hydnomerulius pinastri MD-312 TaxID=994086 RepID=A0A0C9W189_9AGAM|nr:hypothetical protein HYDPIDRAFT_32974 [Hydnomerulius pinastri MD-312]
MGRRKQKTQQNPSAEPQGSLPTSTHSQDVQPDSQNMGGRGRDTRARRPSAKKQAEVDAIHTKEMQSHQRYLTQAVRSRQALEEINDFAPLEPESEEQDVDEEEEPMGDLAFTFRPANLTKPVKAKPVHQGHPAPMTVPPNIPQMSQPPTRREISPLAAQVSRNASVFREMWLT